MRRLIVPVVMGGLIVTAWAAVKFLPWWGLVLALVGAVLLGRGLGSRLFRRLLTAPFKLKGAVLRGATVELHSSEPAEAPATPEDHEEWVGPHRYARVELTVRPTAEVHGPFQLWEPGELRLVKAESPFDPDAPEDDETCSILELEIYQDGEFQRDDGWKLPGPQRLRLWVAVPPGVDRLKFRYYFEEFGQVRLPADPARAVA